MRRDTYSLIVAVLLVAAVAAVVLIAVAPDVALGIHRVG